MSDLNVVIMVGRLTKDPDMVLNQETLKICSFAIANNRKNKDREFVSFVDCQCYGRLAELIVQYCKKGDRVGLTGRLQQKDWETKDGRKMRNLTLMAQEVQFLSLGSRLKTDPDVLGNQKSNPHPQSFDQKFNIDDIEF